MRRVNDDFWLNCPFNVSLCVFVVDRKERKVRLCWIRFVITLISWRRTILALRTGMLKTRRCLSVFLLWTDFVSCISACLFQSRTSCFSHRTGWTLPKRWRSRSTVRLFLTDSFFVSIQTFLREVLVFFSWSLELCLQREVLSSRSGAALWGHHQVCLSYT